MFIEHYFYNFQNLEAIHISFSRWMNKHQWCGVAQSCPTLHDHMDMEPTRLLCSWNSPDKDTGVVCHFLLQGIFLNQWLNLSLLLCRQIYHHLSHQGSPNTFGRSRQWNIIWYWKWAHLGLPGYLLDKTWTSNADVVDSIPGQIPFAP